MVRDEAELKRVCEALKKEPELGVDTESDGFYSYRDKICLIQVSTRDKDYIIDTVELCSINGLGNIFRDPKILKVLHASANDIPLIKRDFGFEIHGIFDTAQALRLLGEKQVGLAAVLESRFGVELNKRFQRYHWGKRPISKEALTYAASDTHYLLSLKDQLLDLLRERGLEDEALENFRDLEQTEPVPREFDPEGFWKIKGAVDLDPRGLAVLREFYLFREDLAKAKNLPPFRVIPNQALMGIALKRPRTLKTLSKIPHLPKTYKGPRGKELLKVVRDAMDREPPQRANSRLKRDETSSSIFSGLKSWRKEEALKRGVDSDLVVSTNTMDEIAQRSPTDLDNLAHVPGMGPCRMERYGPAIIKVVRQRIKAWESSTRRRSPRRRRRSGRRKPKERK